MKTKKTICLNMIVKDESPVILRCLKSVKGIIDYWVIVDTGSTDGTQKIIQEYLKDIPGELHERPWVNFGKSRNEALELARGKADYFLFIDADDRLVFSDAFVMPELDKDIYLVVQQEKIPENQRIVNNYKALLIKDLPVFKWQRALHEYIVPPDRTLTRVLVTGVINEYIHDGNRSKDPDRLKKDIQMLEQEYKENPTDTYTIFLLAQTYRTVGLYREAIGCYEMIEPIQDIEHVAYFSRYCIGVLQRTLQYEPVKFLKNLVNAYCQRPTRSEPLFQIADHYHSIGNFWLAYLVAAFARDIPQPKADHYLDVSMYDWAILNQFYECAYELGMHEEAYNASIQLLKNPNFPAPYREVHKHRLPSLKQLLKGSDAV